LRINELLDANRSGDEHSIWHKKTLLPEAEGFFN